MNAIPLSTNGDGTDKNHTQRLPSAYASHRITWAYALAHFFVDFCSATLIFGALPNEGDWRLSLLLYNFCAFALQMPIGLLTDRYGKSLMCVKFACMFLAAACLLGIMSGGWLSPFIAVLAGLGNGLFHIGAGIAVLQRSGKSAGPLWIFVAPGALGVFLGTMRAGREAIR